MPFSRWILHHRLHCPHHPRNWGLEVSGVCCRILTNSLRIIWTLNSVKQPLIEIFIEIVCLILMYYSYFVVLEAIKSLKAIQLEILLIHEKILLIDLALAAELRNIKFPYISILQLQFASQFSNLWKMSHRLEKKRKFSQVIHSVDSYLHERNIKVQIMPWCVQHFFIFCTWGFPIRSKLTTAPQTVFSFLKIGKDSRPWIMSSSFPSSPSTFTPAWHN